MASIKKNILLNGINTVTGILFPVVTFPYAARVLLPDGIGVVNFFNSIINYIVLFTSLGIPLYAVKEIAKYQSDKTRRDKTTVEIIILSTILCLIGYIAVFILAEFVPQIHRQASVFYVLSFALVFTSIGVNWFYQGIEDFKFITIRSLIFRCISAACLFLFVKSPSDIIIYSWIIVGSTVGNNIINFIHLRKHVSGKGITIHRLNIIKHIWPSIKTFVLTLVISLYTNLNPVMLGFMTNDIQVGYYSAGIKITHVAITVIASIGTALLPRCSHLIEIGDFVGFDNLIYKSLKLIQILSYPLCSAAIVLSTPLTIIFCGYSFVDSIPVLIFNAPIIILGTINNLLCIQILYPLNQTNICIISTLLGGVSNILSNVVLIPCYGATGAAISTLISEIVVLIFLIIKGSQYFPFKPIHLLAVKYIVSSMVMSVIIYYITLDLQYPIMKLFVGSISGFITYVLTLYLMQDNLFMQLLREIKLKLKSLTNN